MKPLIGKRFITTTTDRRTLVITVFSDSEGLKT